MGKCVLEIRDEVNVRFQGLDVKTRRKISDEVKYFLPYASVSYTHLRAHET